MNHDHIENTRVNDDITMSYEKSSNVSTFEDLRKILYNATKDIENVIHINATNFAPQYPECFYSDNVHFTDLGNVLYGNELVKTIKNYL